MISTLDRALVFIKNQRAEIAAEISDLEEELFPIAGDPSTASSPAAPADPNAPRIPMMDPATLSGAPAGGAPAVETFGWGSMPTNQVPEPLAGQWEMIPPGEQ